MSDAASLSKVWISRKISIAYLIAVNVETVDCSDPVRALTDRLRELPRVTTLTTFSTQCLESRAKYPSRCHLKPVNDEMIGIVPLKVLLQKSIAVSSFNADSVGSEPVKEFALANRTL